MSEAEAKPAPSNRKFYLLVAAFLLAAVLMGLLSARRSKSSVEQWKDEMRAKGEKFTIAELLPKRTGAVTNRVDELVRLGKLFGPPGPTLGAVEHFRYLSDGVAEAAWMKPKLALPTPMMTPRGAPPPPVPFGWEDVAGEIATREPWFAEVRVLLAVPDRDVGWNHDHRTPMARCFTEKRNLAQWLAAANTLALHEGQPVTAVAHLTTLLDLAAWHDEDFTLIGQLVRAAVGNMALHSTWATVQAPGVTAGQLADVQARWERLAVLPGFARMLELERATLAGYIARARSGEESLGGMFSGTTSGGKFVDRAASAAWRAFAAEDDELFYLQVMQDQIDLARKLARLRSVAATQPERAAVAAKFTGLTTGGSWRLAFSRMALPNLANASKTALRYETRRELTIAALAVERYRLRHGRPPATLNDLVPAFLPGVPVDWMDGKPLRYRLNADGRFTLWSIGEDLKDDGGDGSDAVIGTRMGDIWERKDVLWPRPPP